MELSKHLYHAKHKGFALVTSITILVLLVVIGLGMITLSVTESRMSHHDKYQQEAKSNARLALIIALGELQKHAGSDLSTTTEARLLTTQGPLGITADPSKQHYTLAFKTNTSATDWSQKKQQAFSRYLISGIPSQVEDINFATQPISEVADTISVSPLGTPSDHLIKVPLTNITSSDGTVTGRQAWWVGDNGAKASISLANMSANDDLHILPDTFNLRIATNDGSLDWFPDRTEADTLSRLITHNTSEILEPGGLKDHRHWMTTRHSALLTNPKVGGFKYDLTAALHPDTPVSGMRSALGPSMFPPQSGKGTPFNFSDPGGPKWEQARSYYNMASATPGSPLTVTQQTHTQMGIYPVIAGFTEFYGISNSKGYAPVALAPPFPSPNYFNGLYVMTMNMSPVVKLWNPYNRPLASTGYTLAVRNSDKQYAGGSTGNAAARQGDETKFHWAGLSQDINAPLGIRYEHRYYIPPVTFEPGEVKIFSLAENVFMDSYRGGSYAPAGGRGSVGKQVDVTGEGYILAELAEQPFSGHSLWDMHFTAPATEEYDAENSPNSYHVSGRGAPGNPYPGIWRANGDGGQTNISDSYNPGKRYDMYPGELKTWHIELYKGKVTKSQSTAPSPPLVSIKNINTASRGLNKGDSDIREFMNYPSNEPYFTDLNIDGIWARSIMLRMSTNQGDTNLATLNPASHPTKEAAWLAHFNPRSPTFGCWAEEYSIGSTSQTLYAGEPIKIDGSTSGSDGYGLGTPGNYMSGILLNLTSIDEAALTPHIGYDEQTERCILFEVPESTNAESHFVSLGQLRHANFSVPNSPYNREYSAEDFFADNMRPAYSIGESLADIRLDPTVNKGKYQTLTIEDGSETYKSTFYDTSWHMNQLWDRTFFSTAQTGSDSPTYNPRLSLVRPGDSLTIDEAGITQNASRLFQNGALNINCTDPHVWAAFLGATMGAPVDGSADGSSAPFTRMHTPRGGQADAELSANAEQQYSGFRALSEEEIQSLSTEIAEQVKQRGPFFSLAEFINRTAEDGASEQHQLKGLLQQAIDDAGINNHLGIDDSATIAESEVGDIYNKQAYAGDIAYAAPGYLTQGDILARMGHLLTSRTDTFTIRAYGEATAPDGKVLARAWCEAEVQRFPEYVKPTDAPTTPYADLTEETNKQYGRKFQIISFRWISPEEIAL